MALAGINDLARLAGRHVRQVTRKTNQQAAC
jgi:hypothetical protein